MMIKTSDQLLHRIEKELIWRRKELVELRGLVKNAKGEIRSSVMIRSAVAMLYAHWEGFVKKTSTYYLEFVAAQRLPYRSLTSNFIGLKLREKFNELSVSKKISGGNSLIDFFISDIEKKSNIPFKKVIDTQSNLSSTVLLDIIASLGLNSKIFEDELTFIDKKLVNKRNYIAHGEELFISEEEYDEIHNRVISLIETFRNEIENSSIIKAFERK